MARKTSSTILQDELHLQADEPVRPELDDARLVDLDVDEESPFLRAQKRVSVRRSTLPKKTATRITWAAAAVTGVVVCAICAGALYDYGKHSWRFRINSSDDIEISGLGNVTRPQVVEVMGGDIGRNIFFVPLEQRKKQLEQIPWVESASVMRFVPNRLKIQIHERTPIAFARIGSRIRLVDDSGTLMELPVGNKAKFSFPVINGMTENDSLSARAAEMKIYSELISELDSTGAHYSQNLSEVELSDPEDVKVVASDAGGEVLVHLGSSNYLDRFKIYVGHVQEWRQQFAHLDSVDLRYEHQIIVNPDLPGTTKEPPVSFSAAKAAVAAGVKPAALVNHESKLSNSMPLSQPTPKTSGKVTPAKQKKAHHKKPALTKAAKVTPAPVKPTQSSVPAPVPQANVTTQTAKSNKPSPSIPKGQDH